MPDRRVFLKAAGLSLASFVLYRDALAAPARKGPNVIYILADDLGYGDLGCYGQRKIATPRIDRMAAEGVRFTRHYAGSTVCAPSRCSLMTGLHTGHTWVRGNKAYKPEGQFPLPAGTRTVARCFQEAGYATGAMGKWGLGGPGSSGVPERQGFDLFFGHNCQRLAHFYYPEYLWKNDRKVMYGKKVYCQDPIIEESLDFIRRHQENSFFLYLPYTIPHAELAVPAGGPRALPRTLPREALPGAAQRIRIPGHAPRRLRRHGEPTGPGRGPHPR